MRQALPATLAVLMLLAVASPAAAQPSASHVTWAVEAPEAPVAPGDTARLVLRAEVADGWKMYAMDSPPPTQGVAPRLDSLPAAFRPVAGGFAQSPPQTGHDPAFGKEVRYFEGRADFRTGVVVNEEAPQGQEDVTGSVAFMVCSAEKCLPPRQERFEATLQVAE